MNVSIDFRRRPQWTYFQMITFSAGEYFALPDAVLHVAMVVFNGVGIRSTILVALSLGLKPVFTVMLYWT